MTDKFTICNMGLNGSFIKENGKIIEIERVVDLLNKLNKENQKLLTLINMKKGALVGAIKDLTKENEQLKQHNIELINKIDFLERVIDGDVE